MVNRKNYSGNANTQVSRSRSTFSGPVLFSSTPVPLWHHQVINIAPIHLALLFHTSRTICGSVMIDFWLPRAKLCCFSANYDSRAGTTRRYDGPRRSNRGIMKFNTFARWVFLRLPRSCRVAEKSDPIDRFSGPDLQKITKNRWFLSNFSTTRHDRAKRRKTPVANVSKGRLPNL